MHFKSSSPLGFVFTICVLSTCKSTSLLALQGLFAPFYFVFTPSAHHCAAISSIHLIPILLTEEFFCRTAIMGTLLF